jgi:hypothetical protein
MDCEATPSARRCAKLRWDRAANDSWGLIVGSKKSRGAASAPQPKSFIVDAYARLFQALRWISISSILVAIVRPFRRSYVFVEVWTVGNLLAALLVLRVCTSFEVQQRWVWIVIVTYGALRVYDIVVNQINILLFDEYRARKAHRPYAIRSYRRMVLLLLHNYVEITVWFGLFYVAIGHPVIPGSYPISMARVLYDSFAVMTGFISGHLDANAPNPVFYVMWAEAAAGLLMTLIVLARFVSIMPNPSTLDPTEAGPDPADPEGVRRMIARGE